MEYDDLTQFRAKKPATLDVSLAVCRSLRPEIKEEALFALTLFIGHNGLLRAAELYSGFQVRDLYRSAEQREVVPPPLYCTGP